MAEREVDALTRALKELPKNHPYRSTLQRHLDEAQAYLVQQTPEVSTDSPEEFAEASRRDLDRAGLRIVRFRESLASLVAAGRPFWYISNQGNDQFMRLLSRNSEIAFHPDPDQFCLRGSNSKALSDQQSMIDEYSHDLATRKRKKVGGVQALMGGVSDYAGLAFSYFDETGVRLLGEDYGYNYAGTKTPASEGNVARVGNFDADRGLHVDDRWFRDNGDPRVFAAPLVVPAGNRELGS